MSKLRLVIVEVTAAERLELESLANRRKTAQALAMRARIVLGCASGMHNKDVAAQLGIDPVTVGKWRRRFLTARLDGLRDEPRSGAPRSVDDARIEAVITRTLESLPPGATHWSSRGMARTSGLPASTVQRIWRAFGLQPHREGTFKLSTDPDFAGKVRDIVGLYVTPPAHAIVLCVDEKSQIASIVPCRGHVQLPSVGRCLRPTPTSASWVNQVERFFALLTERQIRRGVHRSLDTLHTAIASFIEKNNADPKPFRWTKSANDILASIERFCIKNTPERTYASGH